ncbi:MAG: DNRLRE domain-containing protein [Planctomycetes bacterium]|nr:DNRLRE domain-containing protein [Planctomycetota bacterium]
MSVRNVCKPYACVGAILILGFAASSAAAQSTVTLRPVRDNSIYQATTGNLSNGAGEYLFAGRTATGSIRRALVRFDFTSIPANATITNVSLSLNVSRFASGARDIAVHRLLREFGEGTSNAAGQEGRGATARTNDATWLHTFWNTQTWSTAGGDFVSTPSTVSTFSGLGPIVFESAQMLADVRAWHARPSNNTGWILLGDETITTTAMRFDSREITGGVTAPKLTVEFTVPPTCAPDFNADTVLDFFDYLDFVQAYAAGSNTADYNGDTTVDLFDYLDFVAAFAAGC